jgi:hypothetical protein
VHQQLRRWCELGLASTEYQKALATPDRILWLGEKVQRVEIDRWWLGEQVQRVQRDKRQYTYKLRPLATLRAHSPQVHLLFQRVYRAYY